MATVYDRPIYREGNLVKKMYRNGDLIYYRLNPVDYSSMYLTFEILDAVNNANIEWKANSSYTATIQYSKDGGTTWSSITSSYDNPPQIPVEEGDTILFKGDMYMATGKNMFNCFSSSTVGEMNIYGNIMSLLDSTGYTTATSLAAHSLRQLFVGLQSTFINAQNLKIQVATVGNSSLKGLFSGCTYLESAPALPATILEESSYSDMFYGCTRLTEAPELPATVLGQQCYYNMFRNCTSLTKAPISIGDSSTILNSDSCVNMFYNCSLLTTAPELPATTLAQHCYNSMFLGCTSLTTAPELPATTLVSNCYKNMFSTCMRLNYIKCLATDISASNCTSGWVNGVASTGTFVKNPNMSSWTRGVSGIPAGWTVIPGYTSQPLTFNIISGGTIIWKTSSSQKTIQYSLDNGTTWTSITSSTGGTPISVIAGDVVKFKGDGAISTGTSAYNTFSGSTAKFEVEGNIMSLIDSQNFATATTLETSYTFYRLFYRCTGLTSAENLVLPATTLASSCYYSMFDGCTSLTTAPELPATTLAGYCYYDMFYNCTSLTTAPELPATALADYCYGAMFYGCTSLTTAPELPATTLASYCYRGMFYGCTNLNYIKCLATDISATSCTNNWVSGVAYKGTFVTPSSTEWTTGTSGIPAGWTRVNA